MIPARKVGWFERWFARHAWSRMGSAFSAVHIAGRDSLAKAGAEGPLLIVSNHSAWWDPLVALVLERRVFGGDWYAMMDAKNLRRLPFFGRVGAFGVDRTNPSDGAAAMRYAARLLDRPGRAVWIYPQGAERPTTLRPLGFLPGSAEVARIAKVPTVPVALRYEHRHDERPELFIDVGAPIAPERDMRAGLLAHEAAVTAGLDRIERDLLSDDTSRYEPLLRGAPSALGSLAERILCWLTR